MRNMKLKAMPPEQIKILRSLETKEKQKKDRKVLNPQAKELIINVVNFMKREANGEFVVPARKVQYRAALATGFSERTVRRVVKESKLLGLNETSPGQGTSVSFPPKKIPNRPKPKTGLDELTRCAVRKIVHRIYVNEKTVPTIKKIHQKLVQEIGFKGGTRSAHKIVKELGFFWRKTKSKSFVLIEKHDIRIKRIEYLRDIIKFRREGRAIIYLGDTSILTSLSVHEKAKGLGERLVLMHAGGERGFVPNALLVLQTSKPDSDYHEELSNDYQLWIQNTLLPALPPRTVIVIGNAHEKYIKSDKIPSSDSNMEQMKAWLHANNISFSDDMLRPELHQIIKRHASKFRKQKGIIEQQLTERGHSVLRLPPDHPDLNPVDLMWADVKSYVASRNVSFKVEDVQMLIQQKLSELGTDVWIVRCNQVRLVEQQYLECEGIVDHEVERVMTKMPARREISKPGPEENHAMEEDEQDNITFVRHFMDGFLGVDDYKVFNG